MSDEIFRDMREEDRKHERRKHLAMVITPQPEKRVVDVKRCSACGEDHYNMVFQKLADPLPDGYTYLGKCSRNSASVFMKDVEPKNYDLFDAEGRLQLQRIDEHAPDGYTAASAAVDFVRDLELGDPVAISIAAKLIDNTR